MDPTKVTNTHPLRTAISAALTRAVGLAAMAPSLRISSKRGAPEREELHYAVSELRRLFRGYWARKGKDYSARRLEARFVGAALSKARLSDVSPRWYWRNARPHRYAYYLAPANRARFVEEIANHSECERGQWTPFEEP